MSLFFADMVREQSIATGTGDLALGGAVEGHRRFADAVPSGASFQYSITGIDHPEEWETGEGELGPGDSLVRSPLASSAGGAAVDFSAGVKIIALAAAAAWFNQQEQEPTIADVAGLQEALDEKAALAGATFAGAVEAPALTLGTPLALDFGGTGAADAEAARVNLELGSIALQNADAVAITGGSIAASSLSVDAPLVALPVSLVDGASGQLLLTVDGSPEANEPVQAALIRSTHNIGSYTNFVFGIGQNCSIEWTPLDETKPCVSERLEYKFEQGGVFVSEGIGELVHVGGEIYRWRYDLWPHDAADRASSLTQRNTDRHKWGAYDGEELMRLFVSEQALRLKDGYKHVFGQNDVPIAVQINAAEDTFLNLPYINAANEYLVCQNMRVSGTVNATTSFIIDGQATITASTSILDLRSGQTRIQNATGSATYATFDDTGASINGALEIATPLSVTEGGTGLEEIAQGDILYASGADTLSALAKDATGTRYLSNTGASNNPAWSQVDLANGVTGDLPFANLAQGDALSVLAVAGNATADFAAIAAASDGHVLRRSGTSLGFGTVATAGIGDDQVTFAKIQSIATAKVLGRTTSGSGDIEELSTTGTGSVVLSASPTFTGTVSCDALTASGIVTATGSFVIDGQATIAAGAAILSLRCATTRIQNGTGTATYATFTSTGASIAGSFACTGNGTLGDGTGDRHTINGNVSVAVSNNASQGVEVTDVAGKNVRLTASDGGIGQPGVGTYTDNDFALLRNATTIATLTSAAVNLASGIVLQASGTQVVTSRRTGWAAMTGTAARGVAAVHAAQTISSPPTQAQVQNIDNSLVIVAQRLKALIDDLTTHGLIGS